MTNKLPISVLVASFNEGYLLEDCLKSIQFCDEICFINLASNDNSVEIAKRYTNLIFEEKRYTKVEDIFPIYIPKLKYDWFILIDPDERIRPELAKDIIEFIQNPTPFTSIVRVYIWYFFKGKKLKGGYYKNAVRGRLLFFKPGINVSNEVHEAISLKPGFEKTEIPFNGQNYDEHYWCNSWAHFREKHDRYALGEGKVLYFNGNRFSWIRLIIRTIKTFFDHLIRQEYFRDGFTGLGLSFLYARYTFLSWLNLKKFQEELSSKGEQKKISEIAFEQMQNKVDQFNKVSYDIINSYVKTEDLELKNKIIKQYQKSLFAIVNDALEINAFDIAEKAINKASFNDEMKIYISNQILLKRLKLIQCSGSFQLARRISRLTAFIRP
jgi:hypothetical protein